ncbi:hypothetical protein G9Q38_06135 [Pusillimonas sp. DMV24BSW_D]|uniref:DUF6776 family protein n=1 Tax=Neopusillimonas aestuarii TaxID=2716226 RepID=UPI00140E7317|nr:DUF6776 family protein [Pusillimonas sp. DMV24BSW_D]QIM48785.1 hypothetical protein G9Q38_06135 [Pusillimonas sp. DMV24BSW_D]
MGSNQSNAAGKRRPAKRWAFWQRVTWVLVWVVAMGLGFAAGQHIQLGQAAKQYANLQTDFDVTVAQLRYDMSKLAAEKEALQSRLSVEQSTRRSLEESIQRAQGDLAKANERLAFYDQLLPPGPSGSVSIRALSIQPNGAFLAYRVLLTRNAQPGSEFNGHVEFVANGEKNGESVKITLNPATGQAGEGSVAASAAQPLPVSFDQFQRLEGLLSMPEGLSLTSVTLNIIEEGAVRVSRSVNFSGPDASSETDETS